MSKIKVSTRQTENGLENTFSIDGTPIPPEAIYESNVLEFMKPGYANPLEITFIVDGDTMSIDVIDFPIVEINGTAVEGICAIEPQPPLAGRSVQELHFYTWEHEQPMPV